MAQTRAPTRDAPTKPIGTAKPYWWFSERATAHRALIGKCELAQCLIGWRGRQGGRREVPTQVQGFSLERRPKTPCAAVYRPWWKRYARPWDRYRALLPCWM